MDITLLCLAEECLFLMSPPALIGVLCILRLGFTSLCSSRKAENSRGQAKKDGGNIHFQILPIPNLSGDVALAGLIRVACA